MKLSLILEAIDRASRPLGRVDRATTGLGRASRRSSLDVRQLDQRMDGATRSASRLERGARRVGTGIAAGSRQGIRALAALDRRIQFSQAQMEKMAYRSGTLIGGTLRSGLMAGTALGGAGLTAAIYKVVTAGLTFEKFRTQLEGLEGSAEAGERALSWVTDFAAKTPYELTEVMEAFIALRAYGIDPTNGTLRSLGDTAAGMGKSLMQAVEMIADAQTGEFERIKEFGIKASVEGDKVTFRWQRNGKEMSKTVKQTSTDIQNALLDIMDQRFAGGMQRLALTTSGKWSNLMDGMTRTANRVWEGGFGSAVNKQITRINSALDAMEKDGSLKKWADETGEGIGNFIDAVGNYDWEGLGGDLQTTGQALSTVARAINEVGDAARSVRGFIGDIERLSRIGGSVAIDPRGGLRYNAPDWAKPKPPAPAKPSGIPWMGESQRQAPALQRLRSAPVPFMGADRPAPARPAVRPAEPAKGKLEISIKTDAGTTARPTKVAARDMDLEVNTGRRMGGFA